MHWNPHLGIQDLLEQQEEIEEGEHGWFVEEEEGDQTSEKGGICWIFGISEEFEHFRF